MKHIVIGIEGLVGAGKTSLCQILLDKIPNSILLKGGDIYRAIVFAIMQSGIPLEKLTSKFTNINMKEILDRLQLQIGLENRETVVYIKGTKMKEEDLQSNQSSIAVSMVSKVADNRKLYEFGKEIIRSFQEKYNVILSSRDIMRMYPETDYHFLISASLEERVKRKFSQYHGKVSKEEIRKSIEQRDLLQKQAGYYDQFDKTIKVDVTNLDTPEKAAQEVLKYISFSSIA